MRPRGVPSGEVWSVDVSFRPSPCDAPRPSLPLSLLPPTPFLLLLLPLFLSSLFPPLSFPPPSPFTPLFVLLSSGVGRSEVPGRGLRRRLRNGRAGGGRLRPSDLIIRWSTTSDNLTHALHYIFGGDRSNA